MARTSRGRRLQQRRLIETPAHRHSSVEEHHLREVVRDGEGLGQVALAAPLGDEARAEEAHVGRAGHDKDQAKRQKLKHAERWLAVTFGDGGAEDVGRGADERTDPTEHGREGQRHEQLRGARLCLPRDADDDGDEDGDGGRVVQKRREQRHPQHQPKEGEREAPLCQIQQRPAGEAHSTGTHQPGGEHEHPADGHGGGVGEAGDALLGSRTPESTSATMTSSATMSVGSFSVAKSPTAIPVRTRTRTNPISSVM